LADFLCRLEVPAVRSISTAGLLRRHTIHPLPLLHLLSTFCAPARATAPCLKPSTTGACCVHVTCTQSYTCSNVPLGPVPEGGPIACWLAWLRYGTLAVISFGLAVAFRLYQEVWSNAIVVAGFFGVEVWHACCWLLTGNLLHWCHTLHSGIGPDCQLSVLSV
jgi:hypothetical protein